MDALKEVQTEAPMIVRLVGTNAREGRELLAETEMITADTLVDAAQKAVAAA
jgi:succinyl-CoA synthetase beta subunit